MSHYTLDKLIAELHDLRALCGGDTPVIVEDDSHLRDASVTGFVYVIPCGGGYRVPVNALDERDVPRIQAVIVH